MLLKARIGASLDKRRLQKRSAAAVQPVLEGVYHDMEALMASGLSPDQQRIAQGIQDRVSAALDSM